MSLPLVSVVIPAYNAEQTIEKTLNSVLTQSYSHIEIIVVNDGSKDRTLDILQNYGDKLKVFSIGNSGVSYARNLGISHSSGDYIQYLDADDLLTSEKISIQVKSLEEAKGDIAYGDWQRFIEVSGKIEIKSTIQREIGENTEIDLFKDFWCPPAALLYSRRIIEKLSWNENLPVIQDARYLLDAAIQGGKFIYSPGIMALYREGQQSSLSQRSETAFVTDCYRNCREIYQVWYLDLPNQPQKLEAVVEVLRYCINRFTVLNDKLASEAIAFLLSIKPNYIPSEKGLLRTLSQLLGYKNAEYLASIKRKFKG